MDFSNVNQSDKQAETEMVWKCRFHTHTHAPALQGLFQLWGSSRWKLHPYDSGCKKWRTEPDCYPNLSLPAALLDTTQKGVCWIWLGSVNRKHLRPSWKLSGRLNFFDRISPPQGAELAEPPTTPTASHCFPLSFIYPLFSLVSRSRRAARRSPLPAASSMGRVQEGLKRDPDILLHLGGSRRLGLFLRGETKYVLMVLSG